jgi:hypothetical protein
MAPTLAALLCLSPLIVFWGRFQQLYWFHDDWDLISEMNRSAPTAWLTQRYGENFVPVFKMFWEGAVVLVNGSYAGMIVVLWATHFAVLLLLAEVLRRSGFSVKEQCLAVITLGISWSNIESLGWASCWISPLSILFFLLAWVLLLRAEQKEAGWAMISVLAVALASALTFSRGVFTGVLLAFFVVHRATSEKLGRRHWMRAAALATVTALSLAPYAWMPSDYEHFQGWTFERITGMASYAAHYLLLNPLYQLAPMPHRSVEAPVVVLAGAFKAFVIVFGLWHSHERQRSLLWTLLLFEAIMAVLLGLGRFDRDILTAASYRYQYPSLLAFAPFLAIAAVKSVELFFHSNRMRRAAFTALFVCWAVLLGGPWAHYMKGWAVWRGDDVKRALADAKEDERFGYASITAGRARELIQIYNLH